MIVIACNTGINHLNETDVFKSYLENTLQTTIPQKLHYFILLPKIICVGCVYQNIQSLSDFVNKNNTNNNITLIYSEHKNLISAILYDKITIRYDSSGMMDKLSLNIANLTLIKTDTGKIVFIRAVNSVKNETITSWMDL